MSLALLGNHAISRHAPSEGATKWVGAALRIGPQLAPLQWLKWLLNGVVHQQACRDVLNLVLASFQFVTLSVIFIEPEQNEVGYEITGYEVTVVKYHH